MSRFLADQRTVIAPFKDGAGKWWWATSGEIAWEVGPPGSGWFVVIPEGFLTDLGSIPGIVRWLFNPADPQCARAYVLHDYLLSGLVRPNWLDGISSQQAAAHLYEAMAFDGVSMNSRKAQFFGVMLGIAASEW